ncbi:glycosylphosphatidylinositol anchor biosynthesis [Tilletia horrida]|nr:glycosylphosphatidylinositol anchor biosynthesis [Tilletia horrida]
MASTITSFNLNPNLKIQRSVPQDKEREGRDMAEDAPEREAEWERLLWKRQPFPDNYVPASFLDKLQTNATIVLPSYATLVVWSLPIAQQVASILAFVGAFAHLLNGSVSALELALGSSLAMLAGWILFELAVPEHPRPLPLRGRSSGATASTSTTRQRVRTAANTIVSLFLLSLVLFALSPVLRTLTEATTSDSIWALSVGLFALNAALADYSSAGRTVWVTTSTATPTRSTALSREDHGLSNGVNAGGLTSALSLNAAICASVVLSSRLSSDLDVFALMLCAVHIFALLPLASVRLRACGMEIVPVHPAEDDEDGRGGEHIEDRSMHPDSALHRLRDRSLAQDSTQPISRAAIPVLRTTHPHLLAQVLLTAFLVIVSSASLFLLSASAAALSLGAYAFISAGCPAWMRWAQRWKRELKGPWDPAVPRVWATHAAQ